MWGTCNVKKEQYSTKCQMIWNWKIVYKYIFYSIFIFDWRGQKIFVPLQNLVNIFRTPTKSSENFSYPYTLHFALSPRVKNGLSFAGSRNSPGGIVLKIGFKSGLRKSRYTFFSTSNFTEARVRSCLIIITILMLKIAY